MTDLFLIDTDLDFEQTRARTPIEDATVKVSKDGTIFLSCSLTAMELMFEDRGETMIIEVSKSKYQTVTKVIPRIPERWILAEFRQWVSNIIRG